MASTNLRTVVRIKSMARAAVDAYPNTAEVGAQLAEVYERLRSEARALATRAGWNDDGSFEQELPPLGQTSSIRHLPRGMTNYQTVVKNAATGQRARLLLGQLAAWAAGHQEAFELEERLKADAAAKLEKAKAETKRPAGFAPAEAEPE